MNEMEKKNGFSAWKTMSGGERNAKQAAADVQAQSSFAEMVKLARQRAMAKPDVPIKTKRRRLSKSKQPKIISSLPVATKMPTQPKTPQAPPAPPTQYQLARPQRAKRVVVVAAAAQESEKPKPPTVVPEAPLPKSHSENTSTTGASAPAKSVVPVPKKPSEAWRREAASSATPIVKNDRKRESVAVVQKPIVELKRSSSTTLLVRPLLHEGRALSTLSFGSKEPVYEHDCAGCFVDRMDDVPLYHLGGIADQSVTRAANALEARGLVHTLFAMRGFWVKLFELYFHTFSQPPMAGVDRTSPQSPAQIEYRSLLQRYGIDHNQRCFALISSFDFDRPAGPAPAAMYPRLCPNVQYVLQQASAVLLYSIDGGHSPHIGLAFFKNVILGTLPFMHELSVRRRLNPECKETLLNLSHEYTVKRTHDVTLLAMEAQLDSPASTSLTNNQQYKSRWTEPRQYFCFELSSTVRQLADRVKMQMIVCFNSNRAQFDHEAAELRFCQIINRPRIAISYREYLWPDALGFRLEPVQAPPPPQQLAPTRYYHQQPLPASSSSAPPPTNEWAVGNFTRSTFALPLEDSNMSPPPASVFFNETFSDDIFTTTAIHSPRQ